MHTAQEKAEEAEAERAFGVDLRRSLRLVLRIRWSWVPARATMVKAPMAKLIRCISLRRCAASSKRPRVLDDAHESWRRVAAWVVLPLCLLLYPLARKVLAQDYLPTPRERMFSIALLARHSDRPCPLQE